MSSFSENMTMTHLELYFYSDFEKILFDFFHRWLLIISYLCLHNYSNDQTQNPRCCDNLILELSKTLFQVV